MSDDGIMHLLEAGQHKLWGKYRGFVHDRDDPEQLGRLRLRVPSLLGDAITGWAWPVSPFAGAGFGFFAVPHIGDLVWVEFAEGELEHALWTGGGWAKPGGRTEIPPEARNAYPDACVLRTRSGNVVVLDDSSGHEKIVIRAKNGCEITIDPAADVVTVSAGTVRIQGQGTSQALATEDFVKNVFETHIHKLGQGVTGMPDPPLAPVLTQLTSVLKAE